MGYTSKRIHMPCYIVETKFKAGIFLSRQIAGRKKYAESLRVMKFSSYKEAKEAFLKKYEMITGEDIRLNRLYEVRDREIYSVFATRYYVGICETQLKELFFQEFCSENIQKGVWRDCLCYEEAMKFAKERFARIWHNPRLYIYQNIPLNTIITLEDVLKRNRIYQ